MLFYVRSDFWPWRALPERHFRRPRLFTAECVAYRHPAQIPPTSRTGQLHSDMTTPAAQEKFMFPQLHAYYFGVCDRFDQWEPGGEGGAKNIYFIRDLCS